jgi:hypothetical protein
MKNVIQRKIAIKDFYGKGQHVYEDEMGFDQQHKSEARSLVAREVFRYHVEEVGLNLAFYYPHTDTFYAIFKDVWPVRVKTLPRDRRRSDFIGWQCDCDPHDEDQLIATFDDISEVWDGLKIDGKDFEEVIMNSYIVALN